MQSKTPLKVILSSLADALKLEKKRILAGDFGDMPKIAERKIHYLSALDPYLTQPALRSEIAPFLDRVSRIKKMASENETLLQAAKNGVNSAKFRIKTMTDRVNNVGAYTANGEKLRTHNSCVTRRKTA